METKWELINRFTGFQTKQDANKIDDGGNPNGQNTTIFDGDRISVRDKGFEVFGDLSEYGTTDAITSQHTFRKRSGDNVMMVSFGTYLCYYNKLSESWEALKNDYTTGQVFGFADYNINTDLHSYVYFGNAVDDFSRWNGAYAALTTAVASTDATIEVDSTADFAASGNLSVNGTVVAYTSKTGAAFTLTGTAGVTLANGRGIAQAVETNGSNPKGNIYMAGNNRLFIAGVVDLEQAVYASKYGDAMTYLTTLVGSSTATAACVFNLGEGGGGVVGMGQDESALYFFKKTITYRAVLSDSLYSLNALKPFDGKSQTTGATYQKSVWAGGNGTFVVSPDKVINELTRIPYIDYPQNNPISDIIQPTVNAGDYTLAAGITFNSYAFLAFKSTSELTLNDSVLVWNESKQLWDSPITGWNVSDWAIYDNDDGEGEQLYFGSSTETKVCLVTITPQDGEYDVKANWRSKQFDFQLPVQQKICDNFYIEGWIAPNTTITVSLLFDENGFTQILSGSLIGATDTALIYNSGAYNVFGLNAFGCERFGAQGDLSGKKKFRVYLKNALRIVPFYNIQFEAGSDGENQQWEITQFAFKVGLYTQEEKRELYKQFI